MVTNNESTDTLSNRIDIPGRVTLEHSDGEISLKDIDLDFSSEQHPFNSDCVAREFRAFINNAERAVLIEENEGRRELVYYDRESDEAISELFEILQEIVDGWGV